MYSQDQSKGFRLSDTGALWDKYHKESHDQWKRKLHDIEDTIEEFSPIENEAAEPESIVGAEEFVQIDGQTESVMPALRQDAEQRTPSTIQKNIAFLLEQKAVFVFFGIAILFYILASILGMLSPKRKEEMDARDVLRQKKRKGGGYGYKRK